jgi:hypothetical protein
MSYEIRVYRQNNWDDIEEESNISLEEWMKYVRSDKDLALASEYAPFAGKPQGGAEQTPGYTYLISYPRFSIDCRPGLWFRHGAISIEDPDDFIIGKLISIASALNARVMGEEGELYDQTYQPGTIYTGLQKSKVTTSNKKWWKFW